MIEFAGLHLLDLPYALDAEYDYRIPQELSDVVKPGAFVIVPFGGANLKKLAVVTSLKETSEYAKKAKDITDVCPDIRTALDSEMLSLLSFLKTRTICSYGDAVRSLLPTGVLARIETHYRVSDGAKREKLIDRPEELSVFDLVALLGEATGVEIDKQCGKGMEQYAKALCREGFFNRIPVVKKNVGELTQFVWLPAMSLSDCRDLVVGETVNGVKLNQRQIRILQSLMDAEEPIATEELKRIADIASDAPLKTLEKKGVLRRESERIERNPYAEIPFEGRTPLSLSEEQKKASDTLIALSGSGTAKASLLYGVTGSGKTVVMTALIDFLLSQKKSVILLLPEIALTPQSVSIFCKRYGGLVTVIHSALSVGERYDAYCKIKSSECSLVIGTRSAVFSPVNNLGAILIDEEQEHTYKSDMDPKYHTRDVSAFRCGKNNALMVLASATPSLDSYKKAMDGVYTLVTLKNRYGGVELPRVEIADMRRERGDGQISPIGQKLLQELCRVYDDGEQAILFLNRRGYHRYVSCPTCKTTVSCPNCSVTLTYHTYKNDSGGVLVCHWCGYRQKVPTVCPTCGAENLFHRGYGTQRVEEELQGMFPNGKVLRMDTDTTSTKASYDTLLSSFRNHEADFLLGTQMVTKGHDFPAVTLVGVLQADDTLYLDDYRANETTFSMLTQVIGRAGRRSKQGLALIQTCSPDNDVIALACKQDYETFYKNEIKTRKLLCFPPFCHIALLTISGTLEGEVNRVMPLFMKMLSDERLKHPDLQMQVFGPFEAPVYRLNNRYRMRVVIKLGLDKEGYAFFGEIASAYPKVCGTTTSFSVDFNPSRL